MDPFIASIKMIEIDSIFYRKIEIFKTVAIGITVMHTWHIDPVGEHTDAPPISGGVVGCLGVWPASWLGCNRAGQVEPCVWGWAPVAGGSVSCR